MASNHKTISFFDPATMSGLFCLLAESTEKNEPWQNIMAISHHELVLNRMKTTCYRTFAGFPCTFKIAPNAGILKIHLIDENSFSFGSVRDNSSGRPLYALETTTENGTDHALLDIEDHDLEFVEWLFAENEEDTCVHYISSEPITFDLFYKHTIMNDLSQKLSKPKSNNWNHTNKPKTNKRLESAGYSPPPQPARPPVYNYGYYNSGSTGYNNYSTGYNNYSTGSTGSRYSSPPRTSYNWSTESDYSYNDF
jgi:hypothetical protein